MSEIEPQPKPPVLRPRRRWFQYTLRTLLVFVTLFAVFCSWFTVRMNRAKEQREAVKAIIDLGGYVRYDYEYAQIAVATTKPNPPGPGWLRQLVGVDFLATVVYVDFGSGPGSDGDALLEQVQRLPDVTDLFLGWNTTDDGLKSISGLTKLQVLDLGNSCVTDAGLAHLGGLRQLEYLVLSGGDITGAGFEHLENLGQLTELYIRCCDITDTGLRHIGGLSGLEVLVLNEDGAATPDITDAGLEHLKGLTQLKTLGRMALSL